MPELSPNRKILSPDSPIENAGEPGNAEQPAPLSAPEHRQRPPPVTNSPATLANLPTVPSKSTHESYHRLGRWSADEKILFLYGLRFFGKGRWKKISVFLPHRSLVQIKSHAQKVMKRQEEGEDVFLRLDENRHILDSLIKQAAKDRDAIVRGVTPSPSKNLATYTKHKRVSPTTKDIMAHIPNQSCCGSSHATPMIDTQILPLEKKEPEIARKDSALAAVALCQLSHK